MRIAALAAASAVALSVAACNEPEKIAGDDTYHETSAKTSEGFKKAKDECIATGLAKNDQPGLRVITDRGNGKIIRMFKDGAPVATAYINKTQGPEHLVTVEGLNVNPSDSNAEKTAAAPFKQVISACSMKMDSAVMAVAISTATAQNTNFASEKFVSDKQPLIKKINDALTAEKIEGIEAFYAAPAYINGSKAPERINLIKDGRFAGFVDMNDYKYTPPQAGINLSNSLTAAVISNTISAFQNEEKAKEAEAVAERKAEKYRTDKAWKADPALSQFEACVVSMAGKMEVTTTDREKDIYRNGETNGNMISLGVPYIGESDASLWRGASVAPGAKHSDFTTRNGRIEVYLRREGHIDITQRNYLVKGDKTFSARAGLTVSEDFDATLEQNLRAPKNSKFTRAFTSSYIVEFDKGLEGVEVTEEMGKRLNGLANCAVDYMAKRGNWEKPTVALPKQPIYE